MDAVRSVLSEEKTSAHLAPTWQDCDVLLSVATVLKCVTDTLSSESRVTGLAIKPLLNHLLEKMLVAEDYDTDVTKEMKERIKVDLELRYLDTDFDHLLEISSLPNPKLSE